MFRFGFLLVALVVLLPGCASHTELVKNDLVNSAKQAPSCGKLKATRSSDKLTLLPMYDQDINDVFEAQYKTTSEESGPLFRATKFWGEGIAWAFDEGGLWPVAGVINVIWFAVTVPVDIVLTPIYLMTDTQTTTSYSSEQQVSQRSVTGPLPADKVFGQLSIKGHDSGTTVFADSLDGMSARKLTFDVPAAESEFDVDYDLQVILSNGQCAYSGLANVQ